MHNNQDDQLLINVLKMNANHVNYQNHIINLFFKVDA